MGDPVKGAVSGGPTAYQFRATPILIVWKRVRKQAGGFQHLCTISLGPVESLAKRAA